MSRATKEHAQRLGQQPPALVLEGMDQLTQRAVVPARTARDREGGRIRRAPLARPDYFVAAGLTERRRDGFNVAPAVVANGAPERCVQQLSTSRASRFEQDANGVVGCFREAVHFDCTANAI
jgi:hypothetical protein